VRAGTHAYPGFDAEYFDIFRIETKLSDFLIDAKTDLHQRYCANSVIPKVWIRPMLLRKCKTDKMVYVF